MFTKIANDFANTEIHVFAILLDVIGGFWWSFRSSYEPKYIMCPKKSNQTYFNLILSAHEMLVFTSFMYITYLYINI